MKDMKITNKAQVENVFGKKLAKCVLGLRKEHWKIKPNSIEFHATKPAFYLNDGQTLHAYAVDLEAGEIVGSRYCGSADSAINHGEQFNKTATAPDKHALLFIETLSVGERVAWYVHVVSSNLTKQLGEATC